jgi:hypothetical protein
MYQPTFESVCQHLLPGGYRDAKFGIFIHWTTRACRALRPPGLATRQTLPARVATRGICSPALQRVVPECLRIRQPGAQYHARPMARIIPTRILTDLQ